MKIYEIIRLINRIKNVNWLDDNNSSIIGEFWNLVNQIFYKTIVKIYNKIIIL
jgi:hypothetical protein